MLARRTPMKRPAWPKAPALSVTGRRAPPRPLSKPANYAQAGAAGPAVPKEAPARSESYRRAVAALPCIHCGIAGHSQHAHANAGKGLGLKTDDRAGFPLCAPRPGIEGCHARFDQYRLLPGGRDEHAEAGERWAERTRAAVLEAGVWPNRLPRWGDERGP